MDKTKITEVDLVKRSFQMHGASVDGSVLFRKKLSRAQDVPFFAQPRMIGDGRLGRSNMR